MQYQMIPLSALMAEMLPKVTPTEMIAFVLCADNGIHLRQSLLRLQQRLLALEQQFLPPKQPQLPQQQRLNRMQE